MTVAATTLRGMTVPWMRTAALGWGITVARLMVDQYGLQANSNEMVTLAGRTEAPAMAYFRAFVREHLR